MPSKTNPRDWAIGVLTLILASFIAFHWITVGTLQERVATLDERSKNRYAQIKVQRTTQTDILKQLGEISERLGKLQTAFDLVSLGIITTRARVDDHSKQLVRLMVLTRPRARS